MSVGIDPDLKQIVGRLKLLEAPLRARGVTSLHLFGSRAREDHRPASDADLLVAVDPGRRFSVLDLAYVQRIASELLSLHANPVIANDADESFLAMISDDLIEIFSDEGQSVRSP